MLDKTLYILSILEVIVYFSEDIKKHCLFYIVGYNKVHPSSERKDILFYTRKFGTRKIIFILPETYKNSLITNPRIRIYSNF